MSVMMSVLTPSYHYHVSYYPRLGAVKNNTGPWSGFPTGLARVKAMCEPERNISNVKELADGSLMFSFGSSHPSRNTKKTNSFSLSHAEHTTSSKNSFPKRMPSNFKKQSPIPTPTVRKTEKSIRNPRPQNTGSEKVQDNFNPEKVTGETENANYSKRGYRHSQRPSSAYVKRSSISSPKDGDSLRLNKSYKSSVADDIIKRLRDSPEQNKSYDSNAAADIIKRIRDSPEQNKSYDSSAADDIIKRIRATVSKENLANDEKNDRISSKFKFRKSSDSVSTAWRQNPDKTKEEFKEDASKRQSLTGVQKVSTKIAPSRRGPQKTKYENMSKIMDISLPETFVLSRPLSKFVRRSPIPLSAIKQNVRPVPGFQEFEVSSVPSTSTALKGGISRDSGATSTFIENGSVRKDSPSSSENQLNDLNGLKLPELKKMAKSYGLKGYSTLRKSELLELLRNTVKQS